MEPTQTDDATLRKDLDKLRQANAGLSKHNEELLQKNARLEMDIIEIIRQKEEEEALTKRLIIQLAAVYIQQDRVLASRVARGSWPPVKQM